MSVNKIKRIGVFCGSNVGNNPLYSEAARQLAISMVNADITLIYGGANVGLMGELANEYLKNNGYVVGVIPKSLVDVEIAHQGLNELHTVNSMHERKAMMSQMSEAFIMLPGGPGSLEEFFEMLAWAQLGYHQKPCAIFNVCNYYDYLLKFFDQSVEQGFMKLAYRNMIIVEESPTLLLQKLNHYQAPLEKKWIDSSGSTERLKVESNDDNFL